jgi:uncharacterized protein (DUF1330 family)
MRKFTLHTLAYLTILALGIGLGISIQTGYAKLPPAAYLVVSGTVADPEALGKYREQAVPLAELAGLQILARSEVLLLEGGWPYQQTLTIERFDSMDALKAFWYSDGYQQAIKLREGNFVADFIVAVEGQ